MPVADNYFAALNSAVFSDGSFVYVPKGVKCPMELSTYFRINASETGQFERTLIIAEDDSYVSALKFPGHWYCTPRSVGITEEEDPPAVRYLFIMGQVLCIFLAPASSQTLHLHATQVSYLEGCTAPAYDNNQLHAAVVELSAGANAEIKYSTVQNWYAGDVNGKGGIYNFVTKRGLCHGDNSKISWTQVSMLPRMGRCCREVAEERGIMNPSPDPRCKSYSRSSMWKRGQGTLASATSLSIWP